MAVTRISPCLWFDTHAEEAARYYTAIFPNSRIVTIARYPEGAVRDFGYEPGSVMTVAFELDGQLFTALNAGSQFKFSAAISFMVQCATQDEIDYYWDKLTAGGDPFAQQCGWLKDKFGVSWQVVPQNIGEFFQGSDAAASQRAMNALLKMKKLDIAELKRARENLDAARVP